MTELRYNPLLDDWTIVASHRQSRPNMPQNWCPFCPGSGKVPDKYEVHKYDNDFPALLSDPPEPDEVGSDLYQTRKAYGKCEVVLYSPSHTASLSDLSLEHVEKLVELWTERFEALGQEPKNRYIMIFENRGQECGVTMPHPHGQIYAYSWVPLKIRTELDNCRRYHEKTGTCLICAMNQEEQDFGERIVYENEDFLAYLPFFTDYPFGLFIVSKNHKTALSDFNRAERRNLAETLRHMTGAMDSLFAKTFPYMMVVHQRPVNWENVENFYHFHIEFYPPLREANRVKYYASSELGAWAATNTRRVETTAQEFRQAYQHYLTKEGR